MAVATEQPTPDDVAAFVKLIPTLTAQITQLRTAVRQTTHNLVSSDIQTAKGLSLLDLKIQTLLSYLSNLAFVMLLKAEGGKLEEHPVVDKLIEARTVLEKLRPLETKLRYQIEKLVKGAAQALADARVGAEDGAGSTGCGFFPTWQFYHQRP